MSSAWELIEQEYMKAEGVSGLSDMAIHGCAFKAAERVVDRLQQQIVTQAKMLRDRDEELEQQVAMREEALDMKTTASAITTLQRDEERMMRERYRERLDRMVTALVTSQRTPYNKSLGSITSEDYVSAAEALLSAIDEAVEERK